MTPNETTPEEMWLDIEVERDVEHAVDVTMKRMKRRDDLEKFKQGCLTPEEAAA